MTSKNSSARFFQTIIIITLIVLTGIFQSYNDALSPPFTTRLKTVRRNLLPSKVLPYLTFGFTNLLADYYWIASVQDFTVWNGKEGYFLGYFKNISTLDPKFEYPYLFSILTIPQKDRSDLSNSKTLDDIALIAKKGIDAIPTSWQIPFYLGTQYFIFTKNYEKAEPYLAIAAKKTNAPNGVYLVYSTYVAKNAPKKITSEKDILTAQALMKVIFDTTDNETIKKMASLGLQNNYIAQMLQKGITAYKARYLRYPNSVDELLRVNFVSLPKELLDNFTISINQTNGTYKITLKEIN